MAIEHLETRQLLVSTLSLSGGAVSENADSVDFTIQLSQSVDVPVTTRFSTRDATAVGGVDYEHVTDLPVTIPAGNTTAIVSVALKNSFQFQDLSFDGVISTVEAGGRQVFHELTPLTNTASLDGRDVSLDVRITDDGEVAVFVAQEDRFENERIYSVPVTGGPIIPLSPATGPSEFVHFEITPNNRVVYSLGSFHREELFSVSAQGGPATRLAGPASGVDTTGSVSSFKGSPDGDWVVYSATQGLNRPDELFGVPVGGGDPIRLSDPDPNNNHIEGYLITPDGRSVIYARRFGGVFMVPIQGGPTVKLSGEESALGHAEEMKLSPDATTLVYSFSHAQGNRSELFSVPLAGGAPVSLSGPLEGGLPVRFQTSPDSSRVVWSYERAAEISRELFSVPIAGGTPVKLNGTLVEFGNVNAFSISQDSRTVLYEAEQESFGRDELYAVPMDGGIETKLSIATSRTVGGVDDSRFSRDGDHVFYKTDNSFGRDQLYRVPVSGGNSVRLNDSLPHDGGVRQYAETDGDAVVYNADQRETAAFELFITPSGGGAPAAISGSFVEHADVGAFLMGPGNSLLFVADREVDGDAHLYARSSSTASAVILDDGIVVYDHGDAPSPFPVSSGDDGARHAVGSLFLGAAIDHEEDGINSPASDSDGEDEDGVSFVSDLVSVEGDVSTVSLSVHASQEGKLDAWIDFDGDHNWNDNTERIATSFDLSPGANDVAFEIPGDAKVGQSVARFRVSRSGGLSPVGLSDSGEVEDHRVQIRNGAATEQVHVGLTSAAVTITELDGRIVIRDDSSVLFDLPSAVSGSLVVVAAEQDSVVTVDLRQASTLATRRLDIRGFAGANVVRVMGDADLELGAEGGLMLQHVTELDLSEAGGVRLLVDVHSVSAVLPPTGRLFIRGDVDDELILQDFANWRMGAPTTIAGSFVRSVTSISGDETLDISLLHPWKNTVRASDINNDGAVTAGDALAIINELGRPRFSDPQTGAIIDPLQVEQWPGIYFDQNGDGRATALDVVRVINETARIRVAERLSENRVMASNPSSGEASQSISTDDANDKIAPTTARPLRSQASQHSRQEVAATPLDPTFASRDTESTSPALDAMAVDQLIGNLLDE